MGIGGSGIGGAVTDSAGGGIGGAGIGGVVGAPVSVPHASSSHHHAKAKGKHKHGRWLSALVNDIADTARGIGPGVAAIGKATYNDADHLLGDALPGNHAVAFQLDDIAKAVGADYKQRYGMLGHGDVKGFVHSIGDHPLSYILDAATLLSGGAGAVGKAGEVAAITGRAADAASLGGRAARAAGFVDRTAENLANAERAYGALSKEVRAGEKSGLVRGVRKIGQRQVDEGLLPRVHVIPDRTNILLRRRDAGLDHLMDSPKLRNTPVLGSKSRIARDAQRPVRVASDARARDMMPAMHALRKLNGPELVAWGLKHEGVHPDEYVQLLTKTRDGGTLNELDQKLIDERIKKLEDPEVKALVDSPTPHLEEAVKATQDLATHQMGPLLQHVTGIDERTLLSRRLMPQRLAAGATRTDVHPTKLAVDQEALARAAGTHQPVDAMLLADGPQPARGAVHEASDVTPTTDQVQTVIDTVHRQIKHGKYATALASLKRYLGPLYDDLRYGGGDITTKRRLEQAAQMSAKARVKRIAKVREAPGMMELDRVIAKHGAFSREAARLADGAGPMRTKLIARLRDARKGSEHELSGFPVGSRERTLVDNGIHPTDPLANIPGDHHAAEVLSTWLDERAGETPVVDIAHGHGSPDAHMDMHDAQALLDEARHHDPHLPNTPSNDEIAYAIAEGHLPLEAPTNVIAKKEWMARALDGIVHAHVHGGPVDVASIFQPIRHDVTGTIGDRLGIRSVEHGVHPSDTEWTAAIRQLAQNAGLDETFARTARDVQGATQRLEDAGPGAFHGVFQREPLAKPELVNPETGGLYSEEDAAKSLEQLAAEADGAAYRPHLAASQSRITTGPRAPGAVKRQPGAAANLTKVSTGRRFESGTYDHSPQALLRTGRSLNRAALAHDLVKAGIENLAVPFNQGEWLARGGSKHNVLIDMGEISKLTDRVGNVESAFADLSDLMPGEELAKFVTQLHDGVDSLFTKARTAEETGDTATASKMLMVDRRAWSALTDSMKESSTFAKNVVDKPLDVFRSLVLFTRPGYYVNNIVGQHLLLAVKEQGPGFLPRYIAFLAGKNLDGARKLFRLGVTDPTSERALWNQLFAKQGALKGAAVGEVETKGMLGGVAERMSMSGSRPQKFIAGMLRAPQTANELGAILSDDLPRQFRFMRLLQPHVDAARAAGEAGSDAEIATRLIDGDQVLRERITQQTLSDLVDYRGMTSLERKVLRRIIPFYGWIRGITHWTAELGYNHPGQLLALATVGKIGEHDNAAWNSITPDWMHGAIRIGHAHGGTQKVINTQGLNPLSTIADVAQLAQGAFGDRPAQSLAGGTTVGQINPYLRVALQAALNKGHDFSTGMPMLMPGQPLAGNTQQWRGWVPTAVGGFLGSTPEAMLVSNLRTVHHNLQTIGQPSSPTAAYRSPYLEYLSSYLTGVPVRTVNLSGAQARMLRDEATAAGQGGPFG